jgi:ParB-like chromosome segregation protein Spo0J
VKDSLVANGQYAPLVVNKNDMVVVVGNCRYEAMRLLDWTEADCLLLDLTQQQARRLSILDNRSAELSVWEPALLKEAIGDLEAFGVDTGRLGFKEDELRRIFEITGSKEREGSGETKGERFACPKCGHKWQSIDSEVGHQ